MLQGVLVERAMGRRESSIVRGTRRATAQAAALCSPRCQCHGGYQTLITGNQASTSNNDVWGTITPGP